ncbi:hypothetical protein PVAP13_5KG091587 [Panicum virgatum]|uniref:Uncharacterized protein n=1 Tax=Panicum virgatum TaxID=38727 RepID=A0A8T0SBR3_PANVG|nr:hypothetical protein PVAP13_5KG091587 [Panicum virgatum]
MELTLKAPWIHGLTFELAAEPAGLLLHPLDRPGHLLVLGGQEPLPLLVLAGHGAKRDGDARLVLLDVLHAPRRGAGLPQEPPDRAVAEQVLTHGRPAEHAAGALATTLATAPLPFPPPGARRRRSGRPATWRPGGPPSSCRSGAARSVAGDAGGWLAPPGVRWLRRRRRAGERGRRGSSWHQRPHRPRPWRECRSKARRGARRRRWRLLHQPSVRRRSAWKSFLWLQSFNAAGLDGALLCNSEWHRLCFINILTVLCSWIVYMLRQCAMVIFLC